jgi:hypothetical protein
VNAIHPYGNGNAYGPLDVSHLGERHPHLHLPTSLAMGMMNIPWANAIGPYIIMRCLRWA